MKVTNRNARMDASGKHNDRRFDLKNAPHIDASKSKDNIYYTYNDDSNHTFAEVERAFYKEHFSEAIEAQNRRNKAGGHNNRNTNIEKYHKGRNTRPEDKLLQVGDMNEHISAEKLWECALEYKERFEKMYGEHCKILNMALHVDEATPHVHIRRVWIAENDLGQEYVSQTKALEQLGIPRPNGEKPEGRYNNAAITFSDMDRELFQEICLEKELDIDLEPPEKRKHLSTKEYIERQKEELEAKARLTQSVANDFAILDQNFPAVYEREIKELEALDQEEAFKRLRELWQEHMKDNISQNLSLEAAKEYRRIKREHERMQRFIAEEGLEKEYDLYVERDRLERAERLETDR